MDMKAITSRIPRSGRSAWEILAVARTGARRTLPALAVVLAACGEAPSDAEAADAPPRDPPIDPASLMIVPAETDERPPFEFTSEDEAFLDEVQRGAFLYLWEGVAPAGGMVLDRSGAGVVSVAGVGFQLSALPIGVERGWITREEGEARAESILRALLAHPENRKHGLFYHFIRGEDAGPVAVGTELVVSTVDSALLFAGAMTAASYFGGDTAAMTERILADADWTRFVLRDASDPLAEGAVSLGWRPSDPDAPTGDGTLLPYAWLDSGDEHRLVAFMGVAAPTEAHRLEPIEYYRLRRALGDYADIGPMVWFPYSGALFTAFFAHCWIDYASLGADDPAAFGAERRARVDWWENSRRLTRLHQVKAETPEGRDAGLGPNAWGLTASDAPHGYGVPGVFPDPLPMRGAIPGVDYSPFEAQDNYGGGTLAPYGAGSAILFDPERAVRALRHYRGLTDADGGPLVWREPDEGGFGFLDSFNLSAGEDGGPWVATDYVAIDQGPLILAIENARTGRVWRWFEAHPVAAEGMRRLGWSGGGRGASLAPSTGP